MKNKHSLTRCILSLFAIIFLTHFSEFSHAQGWWQRQPRATPAPSSNASSSMSLTNSGFSPRIDKTPLSDRGSLVNSYAPVIEKIGPAVVTIITKEQLRRTSTRNHPLLNDPFFRRFFGMPDEDTIPNFRARPREGLGSGVIISPDGYVVTNNHVIDGADSITVIVMDGDEYEATVVGRDPRTDMAVIKIDAQSLPTAVFADSDAVLVGDVALAIGNPFRLGRTVTKGIVSAIGRDVPLPVPGESGTLITDFIQTDASINPGNSGGALVDSQGRVIGVNTAIFTPSGGNVGIGFAVPSNVVLKVASDIVRTGRVSRGLLGVNIQSINQDMAEALGLRQPRGALVTEVNPDTAAERAGIKPGDLIIEFNGTSVRDSRNLQQLVGQQLPGAEATIKVLRDRKEIVLRTKLGDFEDAIAGTRRQQEPEPTTNTIAGLEVSSITERMASQLQLPSGQRGVIVVNVEQGSNAEAAGLQIGDIITLADGRAINSPEDLLQVSRDTSRDAIMLRVMRESREFFVALRFR